MDLGGRESTDIQLREGIGQRVVGKKGFMLFFSSNPGKEILNVEFLNCKQQKLITLSFSIMVDDAVEGWGELEEVLRQPAAAAHQRVLRSDVHLRPLLDLPLRHGPCILVPPSVKTSLANEMVSIFIHSTNRTYAN